MSEFHVTVVRVGPVKPHPNADRLQITNPAGTEYPVIIRSGEFAEGDLAVYIPVDAVVPDLPRWEFLDGHRRIRAKRLRGVFSMGLFVKPEPNWTEGQDVRAELGIDKYEPPIEATAGGDEESCPFEFPIYTDLEGLRKYPNALALGEDVVLTEKIHGSNGRAVYHGGRLWVGSHRSIKKPDPANLWWRLVAGYDLERRLSSIPDFVFYFEAYGRVQDLRYDVPSGGVKMVVFDVMDLTTRRYLNWHEVKGLATAIDLPLVPELYRGPWTGETWMANGCSVLAPNQPIREGFVVRPTMERVCPAIGGRCILKMVGEQYLTRHNG